MMGSSGELRPCLDINLHSPETIFLPVVGLMYIEGAASISKKRSGEHKNKGGLHCRRLIRGPVGRRRFRVT
jgi:hypothetical protein